ncbi:ketoacyl-synthetase C-terminal extension domain-containing protein [Kitasatospora albolonga]|uniref:ketoacyl-synthetase C-terminal extension domain-containing protein n=1 Tax=Kitasatospora albolonga TaxID=68173 RepID=UPI001FC9C2C8
MTEAREWTGAGPLVAGVNAFGFGGTNAHAVLEQAPPPAPRTPSAGHGTGPHLLTLSARSAAGLREAAAQLAARLDEHPELDEGGRLPEREHIPRRGPPPPRRRRGR